MLTDALVLSADKTFLSIKSPINKAAAIAMEEKPASVLNKGCRPSEIF